uniref:Uncharacterized protein n=1 Tax=Cacopsylla melanoneura TaxID=428564 RepID=A0A8D8U958_9HEMI
MTLIGKTSENSKCQTLLPLFYTSIPSLPSPFSSLVVISISSILLVPNSPIFSFPYLLYLLPSLCHFHLFFTFSPLFFISISSIPHSFSSSVPFLAPFPFLLLFFTFS